MDTNVAIIPIVGMSLPLVLVPVILVAKHARHVRELEHRERMRALELGRTLPVDDSWWSPSRKSVAFGVVVPVGVFLFAWLATADDPRQAPAAWAAATVVGLAGVVSGALIGLRGASTVLAADPDFEAKAPFDADSFDVVGSRG